MSLYAIGYWTHWSLGNILKKSDFPKIYYAYHEKSLPKEIHWDFHVGIIDDNHTLDSDIKPSPKPVFGETTESYLYH